MENIAAAKKEIDRLRAYHESKGDDVSVQLCRALITLINDLQDEINFLKHR